MIASIPKEEIRTDRLLLRSVSMSDAPAIEALASDPEVAHRTGSIPHPYPRGEAERWIRTLPESRDVSGLEVYGLTRLEDGAFVGIMDLRRTEFAHAYEVGFWVGRPFWGRGYCAEALIAIVDFAFQREPHLMRIFALSFPENAASARVQEKAGFRFEGRLRHGLARLDEPRDAHIYAITREDWAGGTVESRP